MLIDVDQNTGVGSAIGSRDANAGRSGTASASNVNLIAAHVELCTTNATGDVQSNNLCTEQIVAGCNVRRDGDSVVPTVIIQNFRPPVVGIAGWHAHLSNLEPALA